MKQVNTQNRQNNAGKNGKDTVQFGRGQKTLVITLTF